MYTLLQDKFKRVSKLFHIEISKAQLGEISVSKVLSLYGSENYLDRDHTLGQNTKTQDLNQIPFGDDVESLKSKYVNE